MKFLMVDRVAQQRHKRLLTSPAHDEAVARCEYLVEQRRLCGIVVGPSGSGKSDILAIVGQFAERNPECQVASLDLTGCDSQGVFLQLVDEFGLSDRVSAGENPWHALFDYLRGIQECQRSVVILVDHLDRAERSAWGAIERLLSTCTGQRSVTMLCSACDPLENDLRTLLNRFGDLRIELQSLSQEETNDYLQGAQQDGADATFESDAVELVSKITGGQPREIERLAQVAVLARQLDGRKSVDRPMVSAAAREIPSLIGESLK